MPDIPAYGEGEPQEAALELDGVLKELGRVAVIWDSKPRKKARG